MIGRALALPHGNCNVHVPAQAVEDRHQTVNREAVEIGVADARKVGRSDAGQIFGLANGEVAVIERPDNFSRKKRLELQGLGILTTKVAKDITAASDGPKLTSFHRSCSLSRLTRSRTKSISCFGVAMPLLDFF